MAEKIGRTQTDQEIIRICKYITDDRFIASYLGVELKRVTYLRGQAQKREAKLANAEKYRDFHVTWNNDAERKSAIDAKEGSAKLLKALVVFSANRQARINEGQAA